MVNSKNIIAGLGVVAGLGVAMLPLTSYAADEQSVSHMVRATVDEVFTLTVESNKDLDGTDVSKTLSISKDSADTSLEHTVTVAGNLYKGYDLTLSSVDSNTDLKFVKDATAALDSADRYDTNTKIPTGATVKAGTSAWGYKTKEGSDSYPSGDTTWTTIKAATSADTLKSNSNASHASFNDIVNVSYGVSASATQAAGVYEAQVIYKATPKI